MAGWDGGPDNDDDVLNLNLFARKAFGFQGIPKEKENILKKIVTQIGATCDDCPKYVFTSVEHYNSLNDVGTNLYNVTYIRDCVDANRCLTVEHYKFGPKYSEKKEYRDFDPCCANFHNDKDACIICDPTLKTEVPNVKVARHSKNKSTLVSEISTARIKKENKSQTLSADDQIFTGTESDINNLRKAPWEPWENRMIIDYLICNNLIMFSKGPSVYKRMISEGFLKHRSAESMRVHFRVKVLRNIESFDLPLPILKAFKKIRSQPHPRKHISGSKKKLHREKMKLMRKMKKSRAEKS